MQESLGTAASAEVLQLPVAPLLDRLRELVLSGDYPAGAAVSETLLAQEFNVSRTPIREALKQLQAEGLVEIRPKVGTFVREPSRREVVEMFQVKEILEGLAAGLMARRGAVPQLELLEENIEASEMAAQNGDSETYARLVHEFHQLIVDGSDHLKLGEHYRTLMNQLAYHRLVTTSIAHPGRMPRSVAEHRKVVAMIRAKDAMGAEWAMRDHVVTSAREVSTEHTNADG
ncbi:GntR family transcriptional regulator [Arthrobacter sp. ISL-28]|uniref:GntR family transcriptional regulator n=1 Tax=Arthrobacter sp. ISL-28 TaxID=2819108 RepID=UPI001BEC037E|nr:GntR family transcriptional regulator [Arthrobacter sp. ISL-28]MBT2523068.1 GntR family transcriptional regulator [Arthrobacter sp. ISL-28]